MHLKPSPLCKEHADDLAVQVPSHPQSRCHHGRRAGRAECWIQGISRWFWHWPSLTSKNPDPWPLTLDRIKMEAMFQCSIVFPLYFRLSPDDCLVISQFLPMAGSQTPAAHPNVHRISQWDPRGHDLVWNRPCTGSLVAQLVAPHSHPKHCGNWVWLKMIDPEKQKRMVWS